MAAWLAAALLCGAGFELVARQHEAAAQTRGRAPSTVAGVLEIEARRADRPGDLDLLRAGVASADGAVQDASIRALGRLERAALVADLLPLLQHARPAARRAAATAIGQSMRVGPATPELTDGTLARVQRALISAASSERDGGVLGEIARTVGRLPYSSAAQIDAAHALLRRILERSGGIEGAATAVAGPAAAAGVEMLARLHGRRAPVPPATLDVLRGLAVSSADNSPPAVRLRMRALHALVSSGAVDPGALRVAAASAPPEMRRLAMVALSAPGLATANPGGVALLRGAMSDPDDTVRYEALRGYARQHLQDAGCDPVMGAIDDTSLHVGLLALDTLAVCPPSEGVVSRLLVAAKLPVKNGAWHRASHALVALARHAPAGFDDLLTAHANHDAWQVRMYAARAAAVAGRAAVLARLAADGHDNVREATLAPLRKLKGADALPFIVSALGRADYQLLLTAARESADLPATAALAEALAGALERVTAERRDTSRDTRLELLRRLRVAGAPSLVPRLAPLLHDSDPAVAAETAATLQAWTGDDATASPRPRARPPLPSAEEIDAAANQIVTLRMDDGGVIRIRLDPGVAPLTATRFIRLARRGYFDGLTFHRVVPNFVLQGGSPGANEYAGDGPYVLDEISDRSHDRGTVGLSTRGRDTGDAQFFINLVNNPRLDFEYTIFGEVLPEDHDRMDRIREGDRIAAVSLGPSR